MINKKLLSKEEMEKLNTRRLLSYRDKLLSYRDYPDHDDPTSLGKSSAEWQEAYISIREILSTREHVGR